MQIPSHHFEGTEHEQPVCSDLLEFTHSEVMQACSLVRILILVPGV